MRAQQSGKWAAEDIAASFQQAVIDCLIDRTRRALESSENLTALVVAGGVAANQAVRGALETLAAAHGLPFVAPLDRKSVESGQSVSVRLDLGWRRLI